MSYVLFLSFYRMFAFFLLLFSFGLHLFLSHTPSLIRRLLENEFGRADESLAAAIGDS